MTKLHLKRTPEEEVQYQLRKERRRGEKRKRRHRSSYDSDVDCPPKRSSSKRRGSDINININEPGPSRKRASIDDSLLADIETRRFREKMFDVLCEDERLDSVEAQMNDFAHVPDRWRSNGAKKSTDKHTHMYNDDNLLSLDPRDMDDEEYAEWIRLGMYRKTHADEYAEEQQQKAAKAAKRAEEKASQAEAARLEKAAQDDRCRRKRERKAANLEYSREQYHARWKFLLEDMDNQTELTFNDIPWPIAAAHAHRGQKSRNKVASVSISDLTMNSVSAFLLPSTSGAGDNQKRERKEKLRETFLRFHPDKFEGRFMKRIKDNELEKVRESIGQVSCILNGLMAQHYQ